MDAGSGYIQDVWYSAGGMDADSGYIQDVWYSARGMDAGSGYARLAAPATHFWDGRSPSLEDQPKGPVANLVKMGMADVETAMDRVHSIPGYKPLFEAAFGQDSMNVDNAARAH